MQIEVDIGFGNAYRKLSQYPLMKGWERKYGFKSALQAPYDPYINDDPIIFSFPHESSDSIDEIPGGSYDLVFNFGYLQRSRDLIYQMKRVARRYVAAFVPNGYNFGHSFIHPFYHKMSGTECNHIDRGDRCLMTLIGLSNLFNRAELHILEGGYVDIPPWFDTVVYVTEMFGCSSCRPMKLPMPRQMVYLEDLMPKWLKKVHAHHVYVFGEKAA